jgi:hypothetical protein
MIASGDLELNSPNFRIISPPRVGVPSRVRRNTRNNAQAMKTGIEDMPTIVDVNEIHTSDYEPITTWVDEEQNPAQEVGQPKEDVKRTKSDASRGKHPQQEE